MLAQEQAKKLGGELEDLKDHLADYYYYFFDWLRVREYILNIVI